MGLTARHILGLFLPGLVLGLADSESCAVVVYYSLERFLLAFIGGSAKGAGSWSQEFQEPAHLSARMLVG